MKPKYRRMLRGMKVQEGQPAPLDICRLREGLYLIKDGAAREVAGLDPGWLAKAEPLSQSRSRTAIAFGAGIATDCRLFVCDSSCLHAADASFLRVSSGWLRTSARVHLEVDFKTGSGRLIVPEGGPVLVESSGLSIAGETKVSREPAPSRELAPGTYRLAFKSEGWTAPDPMTGLAGGEAKVLPGPWVSPPATAGLDVVARLEAVDPLTCTCPDSAGFLAGDEKGRVLRFRGEAMSVLFQVSSGRPLTAIRTADLDGDGAAEVIAGDDQEMLFCHAPAGRLLWSAKLTGTNGSGIAADITVGDIDGRGKPAILVATKSWKLYAFDPDGKVRWESFLFYHPCTKVGILDDGGANKKIAVGNVYHTPLNVVSPADGRVLWHTWEQCGGEAYSTTEYCGLHLTDMVFLDTDGDGRKEIVFGTKYNRVYALDAADGAKKWTAVLGDEVTAVRTITDPATGKTCVLAGTDAGEVVKLDGQGNRLGLLKLSDGVSDLAVLEYPGQARSDIVAALRDGGVVICDQDLLVRASAACPGALKALFPAGKDGGGRNCSTGSGTRP